MAFDHSLLHYYVRDALRPYSEDFWVSDTHNPAQFRLNENNYSVHISFVHDSGHARTNDDEVRIQIGRPAIEMQRNRENTGVRTAFIGFFSNGKTFIAWDPRHVFSLKAKSIVSVYARHSQLEGVEANQASVHRFSARFLGETSFAIALPNDALGFYLENINRFHQMPTEEAIVQLINANPNSFSDVGLGTSDEVDVEDGDIQEKFSYQRWSFPRDPHFKESVLKAYQRTCCICNRQLGIIQAAHIIPHSISGSPNTVQNGLALCIEHHKLYDDGLLLPGPAQTLRFNEKRAEYLIQTNQDKGLDAIEALNGVKYNVPEAADLRPRDEYLKQGIKIRLAE